MTINNKSIVTFGGWYQRTTLHLTEVHQFLVSASSRLDLDKRKLRILRNRLDMKSVERVAGSLEYVRILTKTGIEARYYEDGLYIVEIETEDDGIVKAREKAKKYFKERLEPALNYLFSLGAPTPKILSDMKDDHPIVVSEVVTYPRKFRVDEKRFGKVYLESSSADSAVFKTNDEYIFTVVSSSRRKSLRALVEMQIFFREFKSQLHRYLNIHRTVWEEIAEIKERKFVRGEDVDLHRAKLDSYQKTIRLIKNRINQMNSYASTRASISKELNIENRLAVLFQYRFEDLFNSLEYIKEVWGMTSDYVDSGIQMINEVETKTTSSGIESIRFLAGIGVIMGLLNYLDPGYIIPEISMEAVPYFVGIGLLGFGLDYAIRFYKKKKKYGLNFVERTKKFGK